MEYLKWRADRPGAISIGSAPGAARSWWSSSKPAGIRGRWEAGILLGIGIRKERGRTTRQACPASSEAGRVVRYRLETGEVDWEISRLRSRPRRCSSRRGTASSLPSVLSRRKVTFSALRTCRTTAWPGTRASNVSDDPHLATKGIPRSFGESDGEERVMGDVQEIRGLPIQGAGDGHRRQPDSRDKPRGKRRDAEAP